MSMKGLFLGAAALGALGATAAIAQPQPGSPAPAAPAAAEPEETGVAEVDAAAGADPNLDPNQIVCVRQDEIGSRVNRRRVCRTRAEWSQHQREYRDRIERAQQQMQSSGQ